MEKELLERVDVAIANLSQMVKFRSIPLSAEMQQEWLSLFKEAKSYIVAQERVFVGWNDGETVCAECGAGDADLKEWDPVYEDDLDKVSERVCMDCKRDLRELVKHGFHRPADAFFEFARTE